MGKSKTIANNLRTDDPISRDDRLSRYVNFIRQELRDHYREGKFSTPISDDLSPKKLGFKDTSWITFVKGLQDHHLFEYAAFKNAGRQRKLMQTHFSKKLSAFYKAYAKKVLENHAPK